MKSLTLIGFTLLLLVVGMYGCASIPGETGKEQSEAIDALAERERLKTFTNRNRKAKERSAIPSAMQP